MGRDEGYTLQEGWKCRYMHNAFKGNRRRSHTCRSLLPSPSTGTVMSAASEDPEKDPLCSGELFCAICTMQSMDASAQNSEPISRRSHAWLGDEVLHDAWGR